MKPDFALTLSYTGIGLLARTPQGWETLGTVSLSSDTMAEELQALREHAERLSPDGLTTKVVLPDAHLFFTTLTEAPQTKAQVLLALEGLTPYPAEALVVDYQPGPLGTDVAAVTRLTLAEAETFATQHGFTPTCFAAVPPDGKFDREVFFGPSKAIGDGFDLGPDPEPVPVPDLSAASPSPLAEQTVPDTPAETATPEPETDGLTPELAHALAASAERPLEYQESPDAPALNAAPESEPEQSPPDLDQRSGVTAEEPPEQDLRPQEPDLSISETTEAESPTEAEHDSPGLTFRHRATRVIRPRPTAPIDDIDALGSEAALPVVTFVSASRVIRKTPETAPAAAQGASADTAEAASEPLVPPAEPVFARRRAEPPLSGSAPYAAQASSFSTDTAHGDRDLPVTTAPDDDLPMLDPVAQRLAAAVAATPSGASATGGWPLPDSAHDAPASAPDDTTEQVSDLPPYLVQKPTKNAPAATLARARASSPRFDINAAKPPRSPLPMGLFAAVLAVLFLSVAGAWALLSENGITRFWSGETPQLTNAPESQPAPSAEIPLSSGTDTTGLASAPGTSELSDLPSSEVDSMSAGADAADTPTVGQILSPSEAQLLYAATGVWQRAPRLPDQRPSSSSAPELTLASAVPTVSPPPQQVISGRDLQPDTAMPAPPSPPPPGTRVTLDARGLIPATPQGIISLAGAQVFLGRPEVIPPTRPGTPPPAPEAAIATTQTPSGGPTREEVIPPRLRAGTAVTPETDQPSAAEAPTQPLALADIVRPALRPGTATQPLADPAQTEAAIAQALSVLGEGPAQDPAPQSGPSEAIALLGARPAARPQGLNQGLTPIPAVMRSPVLPRDEIRRPAQRPAGLAPQQPAPEPEPAPEQALQQPEDPTASATAQAVPRSIMPNARPRGFNRTVARARQAQARAAQRQASAAATTATAPQQVSVAAVRPTGPINGTVAARATQKNAFNLRKTSLMGVFGSTKNRRALVRLSNGRLVKVKVGDRLDGGRVTAIDTSSLSYRKSGRSVVLAMP